LKQEDVMRVREIWWRPSRRGLLLCGAIALAAGTADAKQFGSWSAPVSAESLPTSSSQVNTASNDGCPILDPYTNDLYMASNRPGGHGGLDIWIAPWTGNGWGAPVNAGPEINTAADEFCPDPARGNRLFFVRGQAAGGNTDIYVSKHLPNAGFQPPERLPMGDNAINSPAQEWSPSYFEAGGHEYLYFSSTREGRQRIYYSVDFGPAQLAPGGVNTSESTVQDARPNVRHDGLEIVWDSTRYGTLGGPDIWTASRSSVDQPWGPAVHLDNGINSAASESRASLSWDGRRLMFGTTRPGVEGSADIYASTR
jgi:Tol biopolymer transport system component